jgi:hypothetical protein
LCRVTRLGRATQKGCRAAKTRFGCRNGQTPHHPLYRAAAIWLLIPFDRRAEYRNILVNGGLLTPLPFSDDTCSRMSNQLEAIVHPSLALGGRWRGCTYTGVNGKGEEPWPIIPSFAIDALPAEPRDASGSTWRLTCYSLAPQSPPGSGAGLGVVAAKLVMRPPSWAGGNIVHLKHDYRVSRVERRIRNLARHRLCSVRQLASRVESQDRLPRYHRVRYAAAQTRTKTVCPPSCVRPAPTSRTLAPTGAGMDRYIVQASLFPVERNFGEFARDAMPFRPLAQTAQEQRTDPADRRR